MKTQVEIHVLQLGYLVVDLLKIKRNQGPRLWIGHHADGSSGVYDQDRGFRVHWDEVSLNNCMAF